jgi:hypothetical protein
MSFIDGVSPPDFPLYHAFGVYYKASPEQRAKMWWGCLDAIVKIHKLDWKKLDFSFLGPGTPEECLSYTLNYYEDFLDWVREGEPQPVLQAALDWLKKNVYTPERVSLCWGDSRMPNTIYTQDFDVAAAIDWEVASLGDPEIDLAWFLFLDWFQSTAYGIPRLEGSPGREETIQRYEHLTGWKTKNLFYNEILAPVQLGIPLLKIFKNMKSYGVLLPSEDVELNNPCTQRIASLLELPSPGVMRPMTNLKEITVAMQFHITGSNAKDWYMISDKGNVSVHDGIAEDPGVTVTVSEEDWDSIQQGILGRTEAWLSGRLQMEGDLNLLQQLQSLLSGG